MKRQHLVEDVFGVSKHEYKDSKELYKYSLATVAGREYILPMSISVHDVLAILR